METARPDGLEWDAFRDLYYPDSRRHNLEAIIAYAAYRERPPARPPQPREDAAERRRDETTTKEASVDAWEGEGGASHPPV